MTRPARAGFVVDLGRCVGCSACVVACRLENGWASGMAWRRVIPLNASRRPGGPTYFLSVACHHCERPACARACPSAAYEQRADGRVIHHAERCLGCRYCEMACPFSSPKYDAAVGVMSKCDDCARRADAGKAPACVTACPTGALQVPAEATIAANPWREVPGFADPADCRPRIRFKAPRGIRAERLRRLLRLMEARR